MHRGVLLVGALALAACGPSVAGSAGAGSSAEPAAAPGQPAAKRGSGPAIVYGAQPSRTLVLHRMDSVTFELPGGGQQVQAFGRTAYLTVGLSRGQASGFRALVVLDSIRADSGQLMPLPIDSLRAAEGTRWTADIAPTGKLSNIQASDSTTVAAQIGGTLQQLFPVLPAGGARPGAQWTDTSHTKITAGTLTTDLTSANSYNATGYVQQGSTQALEITNQATTTQNGSGTQFGQAIQVSGNGTSHATYRLAEDGTLVHAEGADNTKLTLTVPAVGQTVPVVQTGSFTITVPATAP
ncbi:MAG TPA: hypothetical protein VFL95_00200 [Gemmatimonadales bacterium]|nr:hypothetical protein [Gemmatimonadales bacterium]